MDFYYTWFENYIEKHLNCSDSKMVINHELKKEHTFRVRKMRLYLTQTSLDNELKIIYIM